MASYYQPTTTRAGQRRASLAIARSEPLLWLGAFQGWAGVDHEVRWYHSSGVVLGYYPPGDTMLPTSGTRVGTRGCCERATSDQGVLLGGTYPSRATRCLCAGPAVAVAC